MGVPSPGWAPPGHVMLSGLPLPPPPGLLAVLMPPIDISSSTNEYGSTGVSHFIATWKRPSADVSRHAYHILVSRNNAEILKLLFRNVTAPEVLESRTKDRKTGESVRSFCFFVPLHEMKYFAEVIPRFEIKNSRNVH